ncbi:NosD domain-containing protein [Novosphingobium humi]|uniref:NosD domain-containing protein n=1 Tax=Novosphingobium humi TaxID=2282397 RepID=A0ABY7TTW1_9SPHN|nr:NosD domain-containing protein [Novosphingobium humi]WCT76672.1 NosD domain-containing protein [Novosphingobium humi]
MMTRNTPAALKAVLTAAARRFRLLVCVLIAMVFQAAPAHALVDQTWISAEGMDSGGCLALVPCATLAYAIRQTAPGGTIFVMDSGFYGAATIDRSLTIRSEYGQMSMVASITVNAASTDKVMLDNVALECLATARGLAYGYGVQVLKAGDVLLNRVSIKDCLAGGTVGAGVYIYSTTNCRVTLNDSVIFNNRVGVLVSGADGMAHAKIYRTLFLSNSESGVRVIGNGNDAIMADNNLLGSPKSMDLQSGGASRSFGNNSMTSGDTPIPMSQY